MNKKLDCSDVIDRFLEIDKKEKIPLWMTKHFLTCEKCRRNVRMYTQAEKTLKKDNDDVNLFMFATMSDIKEKLYPGSTRPKRVPVIQWLIIGIVLIAGMVFACVFANKNIPEMQSYTFIFVAGIITTYCMFFVAFNMDFFIKQ